MTAKLVEWSPEAAEDALTLAGSRSLDALEYVFGDALPAISGALRGLFVAAEGCDLICADYTAIEAVGLAELAGVEWRREVFRTHGKIYEVSASKITGTPLEVYVEHKQRTGEHHPHRKLGKVAELASGYQGWIGAWKAFGADAFMSDDEIREAILAWRAASPEIVEFWGGQPTWRRDEYWGVEGAAVQACLTPQAWFWHRQIGYYYDPAADILYCRLLSGRLLRYHRPRLEPSDRAEGTWSLSYEGWNTNPKNGPMGWIRKRTWGGKLTENIDQAVCNDILRFATLNLEAAGYPVVLHVYDEIVSEVPQGFGSIEEFERVMGTLPDWCAHWPVKTGGAWRGRRYRK
jgi:DNA polymerase